MLICVVLGPFGQASLRHAFAVLWRSVAELGLDTPSRYLAVASTLEMSGIIAMLQAAFDLSEAQVHDMLYLRQLFVGKLSQLEQEHQQLDNRLFFSTAHSCHVTDKLTEISALTQQLNASDSEEYRAHMQLASAMFRGVSFVVMFEIHCKYVSRHVSWQHRLMSCLAPATFKCSQAPSAVRCSHIYTTN